MHRNYIKELNAWKQHPLRKPLVLRGARQVGKTWLVREFAKSFQSMVEINFEVIPAAGELFAGSLESAELLPKLSLLAEEKIIPGKTLLFLDEIQECERALLALRYFKEECPELHVIAAGSLLDFILNRVGMPVGRVQFLYLYPLSFNEFLISMGKNNLASYAEENFLTNTIESIFHEQLIDHVRTYMWLGGMPAVVDAWNKTKDVKLCQELQDEIIIAYQQDFNKYMKKNNIEYATTILSSIPMQLGDKFKYSKTSQEIKSYLIKNTLDLLETAGIVYRCYHSSAQGQPFKATQNNQHFKIFLFDIGLAQRILGLDLSKWILTPIEVRHMGAIAEQFVAQEYIAHSAIKRPPELHYWHREAKSSNAEVDFVFLQDGNIIPVEVKSGTTGSLKSMQIFLEAHEKTPYGVKVSEQPFKDKNEAKIKNIPLYGINAWLRS